MLRSQKNTTADRRRLVGGLLGSILRDARSYLTFFVALFLVQTLYTVLFASAANDIRMAKTLVTESYDYELEYRGMTQPQYVTLLSRCGTQPTEGMEEFLSYRAVRYEKMEDGSYNAYITLYGADRAGEAILFLDMYGLSDLEVGYSPLYDYHTRYLPDIFVFVTLCTLAIFALSLFLLIRLYRMRLDRDTFAYGIYMAVGATYRMLYRRSCAELLIVSAMTALPALALGFGITAALYAAKGASLSFSLLALLLIVLFSVLTVLCAVRIPMLLLSRKAPVQLLTARDNSIHVTSPRRSHRIYGAAFPRDYELLSLWRYRRYLAGLLLSAVLLPVLFVSAHSFADILTAREAAPAPDFTVTFEPETVNEQVLNQNTADLSATIADIPGVAMCLPETIAYATIGKGVHMLLPSGSAKKAGDVTVRFDAPLEHADADRYTRATNAYTYTALDEAAIRALEVQYTDIEGDLRAVLTDDHTVVISESINNALMFDFSVGDKLLIATSARYDENTILSVADRQDILIQQLDQGSFVYEEYTVGAVIHDTMSESSLLLGVNFEEYAALTYTSPVRDSMDVYLSDDADFDDWEQASDAVYAAAYEYYHCTVTDHHLFFDRYISSFRNLGGRLQVLAWSFCLMMPLICFFSQNIFYTKRKKEWDVLRSLGASEQQILGGSLLSGLITAGIMLLLILPVTLIADRLLFTLFNHLLPAGGFIRSVTLHYSVPWDALSIVMLLSLLCGLLPPLLAGLRYRHTCRSHPNHVMQGESIHRKGNDHVSEKR